MLLKTQKKISGTAIHRKCDVAGFGSEKCVISRESIYQRIYADKAKGGHLHTHLRCKKVKRKRYASGRTRRNRVGIEQRPTVVESRSRVGDWGVTPSAKHSHAVAPLARRLGKTMHGSEIHVPSIARRLGRQSSDAKEAR